MPIAKVQKSREPLWKCSDEKANKKGILHTVYAVNGDEYTGEWLNNKKHGKFFTLLITLSIIKQSCCLYGFGQKTLEIC